MNNRRQFVFNMMAPWIFGVLAFLLVVGPEILNPQNISWLQDGDPAQHYLGWEFFRRAPWAFPVGLSSHFGMSVSSSIVYTDSIPLIAIPLKLFNAYLGENFQYLGLWILICVCLQAFFALKIAQVLTLNKTAQYFIMALLVFSPTMLGRYTFETSLSSHFLFLAAIYLSLQGARSNTNWRWIVLLVCAALIHFYLFAAVALFWLADYADRYRSDAQGAETRKHLQKMFLLAFVIVTFFVWQAGYFAIGLGSSSPGGYGDNPINLLTLFDAKGWSYIFKSWESYNYHSSDDLNFLGAGLLFLLPIAIYGLWHSRALIKPFVLQHRFVFLSLLALTIFAISHQVHFGKYGWSFTLPAAYLKFAGILRASGRMFWLVYYAIVLAIIYGAIKGSPKKWITTILMVASLLQVVDTSAGWLKRRVALSAGTSAIFVPVYDGVFWTQAAGKYQAIVKILTQDNVAINWDAIARYALRFNLPTNSVYLSRTDGPKLNLLNNELEQMVHTGQYNKNYFYFLDRNKVIPALAHLQEPDLLAEIDGAPVLAPGWKNCRDCMQPRADRLIAKMIPVPKRFEEFAFNRATFYGTSIYVKNMGWEYPEQWGAWSNGPQAQMTLPLPNGASALVLTTRALVTPTHPVQQVQVLVNDSYSQIYNLTSDRQNELRIPITQKMAKDGYVQIWFIFHNAVRPSSLGMGSDDRELAIGLISGKFE